MKKKTNGAFPALPWAQYLASPLIPLQYLEEEYRKGAREDDPMPPVQPYHYGSHYSNSGTVLHFLVRMPPFTKMFLAYQGKDCVITTKKSHWVIRKKKLDSLPENVFILIKPQEKEFYLFLGQNSLQKICSNHNYLINGSNYSFKVNMFKFIKMQLKVKM